MSSNNKQDDEPVFDDDDQQRIGDEIDEILEQQPSYNEIYECQFSNWYPMFVKYTIKSIVIDFDLDNENFQEFLDSDLLIIPHGTQTSSVILETHNNNNDDDDSDNDWSSSSSSSVNSNDDTNRDDGKQNDDGDCKDASRHGSRHDKKESFEKNNKNPLFHFPKLNIAIENAIRRLGGSVFPKLNWSCPKDATWLNNGNCECRFPGDIYMLLKASDSCHFDTTVIKQQQIQQQHDSTTDENNNNKKEEMKLQLVLRKFRPNLYRSQEFRCFIYQKRILAISQRHDYEDYPHLTSQKSQYKQLIMDFYQQRIVQKFPLENYVLDVYIDQQHRVWIIDFNVWATRTDPLLFNWSELLSSSQSHATTTNGNDDHPVETEFRIVDESTNRQVRADPLSNYRAPIDTTILLSGCGATGDNTQFQHFMNMCQRPSTILSSSSDDDDDDDDDNAS